MRTTLQIDDDVLDAARSIAHDSDRSIGAVISDLVRQGLAPKQALSSKSRSGFPVVTVPHGARPITSELVAEALDEW